MSDFYLQEVKRPKGLRWLIASRSSADFAVFDDRKNAMGVFKKLLSGEAKFCPTCGGWILYKGGWECPQCFLASLEIGDAAERNQLETESERKRL